MWRVLDEKYHTWDKDFDYLKCETLATVSEEFDVQEINGKMYSCGIRSPKHKILFVKEFTYKEEHDDTCNNDDFECPYCGAKVGDSWEYSDGEQEIECGTCYKTFIAYKEIEVSYKTSPKGEENV